MLFVFFFKQKTAYEMRISDWSSDVCSSDLADDDRCGIDVAARKGAALARLAAVAAQIDAVGDAKQLLRWNRPLACRDRHEREGWHHDLLGPAERDAAEKVAASELRSEEHTSELQSLMRISYAVFCLK